MGGAALAARPGLNGRFITLEGGEGVGKSTQAALLAEWLRGQGKQVVETREPGGTPGGEAIRRLLLTSDVALGAMAEAYLFAAARADHVERLIAPALGEGKWVICDRFVDSSLAYQGAASGLGMERIGLINAPAITGRMPELTILLRLGIDDSSERTQGRDGEERDRFSVREAAYHRAVAAAFDRIADEHPHRIAPVDASADIAVVASRINDIVTERLL